MDTSVDRSRVGLAGAKTRHGLTEAKLRELPPGWQVLAADGCSQGRVHRGHLGTSRLGACTVADSCRADEGVKPHTVYPAEQGLEILTTLRTCFPSSNYVHPSRYDSAEPISQATLNRTIAAAVDRINEDRTPDPEPFQPVSVHDLCRTRQVMPSSASTLQATRPPPGRG